MLWPGQRYGFGGMLYLERAGATRVEVEVGEPDVWVPVMEASAIYGTTLDEGPVEATNVGLEYGLTNEPIVLFDAVLVADTAPELGGLPSTSFSPMASAIFRDSDGRIIGGADTWLVRPGLGSFHAGSTSMT